METPVDDPTKQTTKDRLLALDPALREKAKRWFAEARELTKRDDEEIARWHHTSGGSDGEAGASATTAVGLRRRG